MKITIRTNPEIVIEIDQEKVVTANDFADKTKCSGFPFMSPSSPDVKPEPKAKIEKRGKGIRHCKKCGETGHRSDYCPQDGEGTGTVKEKIRNLKDEGLTEDEVADRLGISIYAVNKYWDD